MNLVINGLERFKIDDNKYYIISNQGYGVITEISKAEFIKELESCSWIIERGRSKDLKIQYVKLLTYVYEN